MTRYKIVGLPNRIAYEVRSTGRSPGYGHPIYAEVAAGTGPCRSCLTLFDVGQEERLLFTYQPASGDCAVGAPGPVFIHREECGRYEGTSIPDDLRDLPLLVEGRTNDGTVLRSESTPGDAADEVIESCLAEEQIDFVFLRHGEAGCHIARIDRM